jgi:Putative MetA-pathway of phenol degradation
VASLSAQETRSLSDEIIEPIITEETLPEEPGACDLRTSVDYRADALEPANALPRMQLFCGFASRWGAEFNLPFAYPDQNLSATGLGDMAATLKYRVNGIQPKIPTIVLGVETRFPTGNPLRGTGEEGYELEPFVAFLTQRSRLGLQGNFGIGFPAGAPGQTIRTYYNLATTVRLTSKNLYFSGEANASHAAGGENTFAISPGVHYAFSPRAYAALASPINVAGGTGRVGIVLQMQFQVRGERESE